MVNATFFGVSGFGKSSNTVSDAFLTGNIGEFRFFSRAITQADAMALYNGTACPPPLSPRCVV